MTQAERDCAVVTLFQQHVAEWAVYQARPPAERRADEHWVLETFCAYGAQAARDMMRVQGMPTLPGHLCTWTEVCGMRVEELHLRMQELELLSMEPDFGI